MLFGYDPNDTERIFNKVQEEPYNKEILEVTALYKKDGQLVPLSFMWKEKEYKIEKVLECQKGQSLKFGQTGLRYRCLCASKKFYLHYTGDPLGKWYVEVRKFNC